MILYAAIFTLSVLVPPVPGETPLNISDSALAMIRAGASPSSLAAAGVSGSQAVTLLAMLALPESQQVGALLVCEAEIHAAAAEVGSLSEAAVRDPFDAALRVQLSVARSRLTAGHEVYSAAKASLLATVMSELPAPVADRLAVCVDHGPLRHDLPAEYRVLAWEPDRLESLLHAIIAARRAERLRETASETATGVTQAADGELAVIEAQQNLEAFLAGVEHAFAVRR